ncbi:hypothetical protein [Fulvivirga aurantia]|uniref:hypothetical protein n=1 Tax=Fulvivirga aurantia TaxID=2529383 RepID=UPI0012BCFC1A|nr:hypothetical protein [Fulvivirga aurantia]
MIIDIRSHFKKIQKESKIISKKELEAQLKNAMSYLNLESSLRKLSVEKGK